MVSVTLLPTEMPDQPDGSCRVMAGLPSAGVKVSAVPDCTAVTDRALLGLSALLLSVMKRLESELAVMGMAVFVFWIGARRRRARLSVSHR